MKIQLVKINWIIYHGILMKINQGMVMKINQGMVMKVNEAAEDKRPRCSSFWRESQQSKKAVSSAYDE